MRASQRPFGLLNIIGPLKEHRYIGLEERSRFSIIPSSPPHPFNLALDHQAFNHTTNFNFAQFIICEPVPTRQSWYEQVFDHYC